jgi:hypothetical protein
MRSGSMLGNSRETGVQKTHGNAPLGDTGQKPGHDPDPAEIEIDQANDVMGGPTTGSLSAGLPSETKQRDAEALSAGGMKKGRGHLPAGPDSTSE